MKNNPKRNSSNDKDLIHESVKTLNEVMSTVKFIIKKLKKCQNKTARPGIKDYNKLKEYILTKQHRALRRKVKDDLPAIYSAQELCAEERMTRRFEYLCAHETPIVLADERIAFLRTLCDVPHIYTEEEFDVIKKEKRLHELGFHSNVTPDYDKLLKNGLLYFRNSTDIYGQRSIDALIALCDRYTDEARRVGNDEVAATL